MGFYQAIPFLTAVFGVTALFTGLLIRRYPSGYRFFHKKEKLLLEKLAELQPFKQIIILLTYGKMNNLYQKFIYRHFLNVTVDQLLLIKILCVIGAAVIAISIRYTNNNAIKAGIIANMHMEANNFSIFQNTPDTGTMKQNQQLYSRVIEEVKTKHIGEIDNPEKIKELKQILSGLMSDYDKERLEIKAAEILNTMKKINNIQTIDWLTLSIIVVSFWAPEAVVLTRRILFSSSYSKEIIKLENVFEMLGSVGNLKTVNILDQLTELSRVYKIPMEKLRDTYRVDREAAFNAAIEANNHIPLFRKFAESIRVYSCVDKQLAVQIIEKNIKQREEERYLMSEEDADMVEIAAFMSIVPIVWQLMDLMLRPMTDFIINSFSLI